MTSRALPVALLALAALPSTALAWGEHYMLSDRAFSNPEVSYVEEKVQVEPLDAFLSDQAGALTTLFADYYAWEAGRGNTRFKPQTFDPAAPTVANFLHACRLNPETTFALVNRVLPGQKPTRTEVDPTSVWPGMKEHPPLPLVFEDVTGLEVSGHSVLTTFADEPDWQMDRSLWTIPEYGYGTQPYGKTEGEGTKAPFHIQYMHENMLVRKFAPEMTEGMMLDRIELYLRLSKLAFDSGHPYWGYRFAAWGTHFIEDLSQPYHARAVPWAHGWYYLHFALSPAKDRIKTKTTALVTNRHLLYEDYVAYGLLRSYTAHDVNSAALGSYLTSGETVYAGVDGAEALMEKVSQASFDHGPAIDRALRHGYPKYMVKDPKWDIEKDPEYSLTTAYEKVDPDRGEALLEATGVDFERAGIAARTLVTLARRPQ